MNNSPKILAFAGSLRRDSFNKKLLKYAIEGARESGGEVTEIDLSDFRLPLYDGDLEEREGLGENAKKLKQLMIAHDAFLISSPEYNSSIPGPLKNVIDWASRPEKEDPYELVAFRGKFAALLSASPSFLGGLRGLVPLRAMLENIFVFVLPSQVTLAKADQAFDEKGHLKDQKKIEAAKKQGSLLVDFVRKMKG